MTDRWQKQAEAIRDLVEPLINAVYAQAKEGRAHDDEAGSAQAADDALMAGIRAALFAVFELGKTEEREECAKAAEELKADAEHTASYYANLGDRSNATAQRIQSITFGIAAHAIRSREAPDAIS